MRALETTRLLIRAFTPDDAETYSRLLDEAFGQGAYGSSDEKRVVFEYQVAADAGMALLHQPPYRSRDRAARQRAYCWLGRIRAVSHALRSVAFV